VDRLVHDLDHPFASGIEQLRSATLAADRAITEHVR